MREKNRIPIASHRKLPQFTTMNVIDGQAGLVIYSSLIFYSLTIDNILNIIVLLILAGVTIVTLTGDNGLLQKAQTAKEENEEAKELELIKLAVSAAQVAGEGKLNTTNLKNELEKNLNDNDIDNNLKPISDYWNYKGYKIDKNGKVEEYNNMLPPEYQQVEYIESTGTQYVFIGEVEMSNIIAEMQYPNFPNGCGMSGGMDGYGNKGRLSLGIYSSNYYMTCYGDKSDSSNIIADSKKHIYNLNISKENINRADLYVDDVFIYSQTAGNLSHPLYFTLFAYTGFGETMPNRFASCRIFKFELEGQMKLYPCYRKSDNVIGMYDTVDGKFYTNQGTGEFIAGPEV